MSTMQQIIQQLHSFWLEQGCILGQPYNTEVGAGTLNPATSLRVLGPEQWKVAYVEPSVRPDDSRYGQNPNRLQTHTQYQVILKPTPTNPQEVFLGSLEAIGIDLSKHDVRFVEDNWASPALGAWGLGWEVWLDGLEITQFTYFQQSGTQTLNPVPVEITYGLERIVMALQNVSHFKDIEYASGIKYGDFLLQPEAEMSTYYLDTADVDTQRRLFDLYEAEAQRQLASRLAVPAHYQLLKMSHAFNVLDSRGAVGTAERAHAFARMRELARDVSSLWIETTAERGNPLGVAQSIEPATVAESHYSLSDPATLALEIGTEELPPNEVIRSTAMLESAVKQALDEARITHGPIHIYSTPRRLIAIVEDVAPQQTPLHVIDIGPKVSQAYTTDGVPGPAAVGFARKHGVEVSQLIQVEHKGDKNIAFEVNDPGKGASEILAECLPIAIRQITSSKNMRWNAPDIEFSRPIRYVLALHGEHVVSFAYSNLAAGRTSRVLRNDPTSLLRSVVSADELLNTLRSANIEPDGPARRDAIIEQTNLLLNKGEVVNFDVPVLSEVVNLVEQPTVVIGEFESSYLELPAEILIGVMSKHQRYLPVQNANGSLSNRFVAVANGHIDPDTVRLGNQNVLAARYADAAFFWTHDLQTPLETMAERLHAITFQKKLGSLADHCNRSSIIATAIAEELNVDTSDIATLARAGAILKFDLGSQMVTEMTSLAGLMAREYARRSGESEKVATALYEAETGAPASNSSLTTSGALLAISERADTLIGLFATGAKPTGSRDPFGLRRAAGTIAEVLIRPSAPRLSVTSLLQKAAEQQPVEMTSATETVQAVATFIQRRLEQILIERGHGKESVRSVMTLADRPAEAFSRLVELEQLRNTESFTVAFSAFKRVANIAPFAQQSGTVDPAKFQKPEEDSLYNACKDATTTPLQSLSDFVDIFVQLSKPINEFLDQVIVNTDDREVRENRLTLLAEVRRLADGLIDWNALPYEPAAPPTEKTFGPNAERTLLS